DEEAVVLGALAVAALHLGIVAGGADDRGAQIVQHDTARDAAEELERGAVQASPGLDALVENELGILMAAARQRHHEHPSATDLAALGVEELPGEAKVDLGLLPRGHLHPERGPDRGRRHAAEEALHRGVAAREAVGLDQELPDRLPLDALLM